MLQGYCVLSYCIVLLCKIKGKEKGGEGKGRKGKERCYCTSLLKNRTFDICNTTTVVMAIITLTLDILLVLT